MALAFATTAVAAVAISVPVALTRSMSSKAVESDPLPVETPPTGQPVAPSPEPVVNPSSPDPVTEPPATQPVTNPPATEVQPVVQKKGLLIVAAGQSNMQGVILSDPNNRNSYRFSDKTPVIYTAYNNTYPANKSTNITDAPIELKSAGEGPGGFNIVKGIAFKQAETEKYSKIWVVNSSVGGTGFRNSEIGTGFPASQNPFGRAYQVDMIRQGIDLNPDLKTALINGAVDVVMTWLQGENDTNYVKTETEADQYADMIASYLTTIRELLPILPGTVVPILVGAMEPTWSTGFGSGAPAAQRQLVQQAIATIPGKLEYSAHVNSNGLPVNSIEKDWIHYGLTQLGQMADRYIQAIPEALANGAANRLPLRSLDNRIFAQFTNAQTSYWPNTFGSDTFHMAVSFNRSLANLSSGYPTNSNFSNLGKLYAYKSGDSDLQKRYRIRMRLYSSNASFLPFVEIYFVQSVNPVFYSTYAGSNVKFEVESVKVTGSGAPAFTKENVDLKPMMAIGANPSDWSAGPYASVFTMSSGATDISFPRAGNKAGPLGQLATKDNTTTWSFGHITLDAIIPGIS